MRLLPENSTNVRIESPLDPWPVRRVYPACAPHPPRAPRVALVAWTAFVTWASADGVFARLEAGAFAALVAFVLLFGVAACVLDREARAALAQVREPLLLALALDAVVAGWMAFGLDGVVGGWMAFGLDAADASHAPISGWAGFPGAIVWLVVAPLAAAMHLAAARRPRLRRAAGASPAAKRAVP
jgi:hypothetical protein